MVEEGYSIDEISKRTGIGVNMLKIWYSRYGIKINNYKE